MKCWIALSLAFVALNASAQSVGYYEPLRYRDNDPFVFCTQGQDLKLNPAPCWKPLPPYTGNHMWMPYCRPPNPYGKDWTDEDWDSYFQYLRVCPAAIKSGRWEGEGRPESSPYEH